VALRAAALSRNSTLPISSAGAMNCRVGRLSNWSCQRKLPTRFFFGLAPFIAAVKPRVRLHRIVELSLTAFLLVIALTGCVIAWFTPLDEALNEHLWKVKPQGQPHTPLELCERLAQADPNSHAYYIHFPERPDKAFFNELSHEGALVPYRCSSGGRSLSHHVESCRIPLRIAGGNVSS
jgi:hypothetical protein